MKKERGQALILVAFAMVALIAITGLAIDGGKLYSDRRNMQNSADSASLAGALVLAELIKDCKPGNGAQDLRVAGAIIDFAERNGLPYNDPEKGYLLAEYVNGTETILGEVGIGSIPNEATGIHVTLVITDSTLFMGMMGQDTMSAGAEATAMVGTTQAFQGNLIPIALPLQVVGHLSPGTDFVIAETNDPQAGMLCTDKTLTYCNGDMNSNASHRAWLNLNYIYNMDHRGAGDQANRTFLTDVGASGCGAFPNKSIDDGLQGWAGDDKNPADGEADCPYPFDILAGYVGSINGDFIHGDPGSRQSAMQDVVNTYNHKIAYVPIFDNVYTSEYMEDNLPRPEEPPDGDLDMSYPWPTAGGGAMDALLYHVVGFAAVEIDDPNSHDHYLEGTLTSAIVGKGPLSATQGIGNQVCAPTLYTVALWR